MQAQTPSDTHESMSVSVDHNRPQVVKWECSRLHGVHDVRRLHGVHDVRQSFGQCAQTNHEETQ